MSWGPMTTAKLIRVLLTKADGLEVVIGLQSSFYFVSLKNTEGEKVAGGKGKNLDIALRAACAELRKKEEANQE